MWAHSLSGPSTIEASETPAPRAADLLTGEVLLRFLAGAICGSDLGAFRGHASPYYGHDASGVIRVPGFPLHEVVGEVVASQDPRLAVGQKAVGWATAWNGLAEYLVTAGSSLVTAPPDMDDVATTVIQPLACVLFTVAQLADVSGKRAAVIGQGPLGVLFSHALKSAGAAHVTGVDLVDRSDVAESFGVDLSICNSSSVWSRSLDDSARPDVVIEAVGHQVATINDAVEAVAFGGQIFGFGVPDDLVYPLTFERLFRKNVTLRAGAASDRTHWLSQAAQYLARHPRLAPAYVTHTFRASEAQSAFETAARPAAGRLKVAITA